MTLFILTYSTTLDVNRFMKISTPLLDSMDDEWLAVAQEGLRAHLPDNRAVAQLGLVLIAALTEARATITVMECAMVEMMGDCEDGDTDEIADIMQERVNVALNEILGR